LGKGARGFFVSGPCPLPQTPSPNPHKGSGEGGTCGPDFAGPQSFTQIDIAGGRC